MGLLYESKFIYDALSRGFDISMPLGNHQPYDVVLHSPTGMHRVQIKFRSEMDEGRFDIRKKNRRYGISDYDVLAVYLATECAWFLFPFVHKSKIYLNDRVKSEHKENWSIFTEADPNPHVRDQGSFLHC